jgi:hypothetical protein
MDYVNREVARMAHGWPVSEDSTRVKIPGHGWAHIADHYWNPLPDDGQKTRALEAYALNNPGGHAPILEFVKGKWIVNVDGEVYEHANLARAICMAICGINDILK